jgi:hypothetical protein
MVFPEYKTVPTVSLIPYARNSRTHSETQIAKIAASIREFGFLNPIITDGNNGIVAGHGRVMAAQKLGLDILPVIEAAHLTEAQKRAYVLADNRLALDAGWDSDLLRIELQDLDAGGFDLSLTGFDVGEITGFLADPTESLADPDAVPEQSAVPVTVRGDVWLLGRHRLMCGDSSVDRGGFLDGVDVDMTLLDPPYEVSEAWGWHDFTDKVIVFTDNKHIAEPMSVALKYPVIYHFVWDTSISWYTDNRPLCRHRSAFYCANEHGWDSDASVYIDGVEREPHTVKGGNFGGIYNYEPLPGGAVRLQSVYRKPKTAAEGGNGKPVQWVRSLLAGTRAKEVFEPFGGTGATLVAAPDSCRVHSIEINPVKVDQIVRRWQQHTGQRATNEATGEYFGN